MKVNCLSLELLDEHVDHEFNVLELPVSNARAQKWDDGLIAIARALRSSERGLVLEAFVSH